MPNQLRRDPTRTTVLRRQMVADMTRRFKIVNKNVRELIVNDDAFGLKPFTPFQFNQQVEFQAWRFQTNPQKVRSFRRWLQTQIDNNILTAVGGVDARPWTAPYIESAYRKGLIKAYRDVHSEALAEQSEIFQGTRDQFINDAFNSPVATEQIELLYQRTFTELEGVTKAMDQQLSRILANGLVQGQGADAIAREMSNTISKLTRTRANVIARTEIVRSHAEGTLTAFERLGVEEVGILAEWQTAGDERVCPECDALEGVVMTIDEARGMIPRHPQCRCAWVPANRRRREPGQVWLKKDKQKAIKKSIREEGGRDKSGKFNKTLKTTKKRSTWLGKELI